MSESRERWPVRPHHEVTFETRPAAPLLPFAASALAAPHAPLRLAAAQRTGECATFAAFVLLVHRASVPYVLFLEPADGAQSAGLPALLLSRGESAADACVRNLLSNGPAVAALQFLGALWQKHYGGAFCATLPPHCGSPALRIEFFALRLAQPAVLQLPEHATLRAVPLYHLEQLAPEFAAVAALLSRFELLLA